ncbi:MAG: hypothetical protein IPJ19_06670 [Planctomycetes bacterium]|nr:hypothetical protein [Planctomycetota bacterium]
MLVSTLFALLPFVFPAAQGYSCTDDFVRALEGQPGPEGGLLTDPLTPRGATFGAGGRVAFTSGIAGLTRNQAVLVSDGESLRAVAIGSGGVGGSGAPAAGGDATPLGGSFAGFFADPWFAPASNAVGDVAFLADLFGAPSPRALFLQRAATGALETVAFVGELSPSGHTLTGLGAASLDAHGDVLLLARTASGIGKADEILSYAGGVLALVAREGDLGPDGPYESVSGEFQLLPDGTSIATGPVPARDELGRIAHFAVSTQTQLYGIVLDVPGQAPAWFATFGQVTPGGGFFSSFGAPLFAPNGELVFSAQYMLGSSTRKGWFAGTPGNLRAVFTTLAPIGTSLCINLERSRGPFQPLGRGGDVVLWAAVQHSDLSLGEMHLLVHGNGAIEVLAETGSVAPSGGVLAELGRFPSLDVAGRVLESARISSGPSSNAVWIRAPCGTATSYCEGKRSSLGCIPRIDSLGTASVSSAAPFLVTGDRLPSHRSALLFYGFGTASLPFQGATLCLAAPLHRTQLQTSSGPSPSDCTGTLAFDFGARIAAGSDPALVAGAFVTAQWLVRDPLDPQGFGTALSDGLEFVVGP